ncbi:MAG TPA: hypothetical protein VHO91_21395 [Rhodopila sp.]|nr:hypothetical protein [Rhodopila sp.]
MAEATSAPFSVATLAAERNARRRLEREAEEQLARRKDEEHAAFKKRLETFQLTPEHIETVKQRIRRAFERGETELMFASFPSDFCTDGGRAINNAGTPPIVAPSEAEKKRLQDADPEWLATLPAGARPVYEFWKTKMKPAGFHLSVRIINYPGGKPGDVGMFFSWPKDALET